MAVWGYHAMFDCANCDIARITDQENIYNFVKELVPAIDMKAYGEPQIVHFAEDDPSKAGYTLVQLIETSNITAHFVDDTGEAFVDVFSCKNFDADTVSQLIKKYFNPTNTSINLVKRQAK
jgi:S-adenosylmethionine/arginine decarboxylase-like enzyme